MGWRGAGRRRGRRDRPRARSSGRRGRCREAATPKRAAMAGSARRAAKSAAMAGARSGKAARSQPGRRGRLGAGSGWARRAVAEGGVRSGVSGLGLGLGFARTPKALMRMRVVTRLGEAEEEGLGGVDGKGGCVARGGDVGDGAGEAHQGGDDAVGGVEGGGREHERKENIKGGCWQGGGSSGETAPWLHDELGTGTWRGEQGVKAPVGRKSAAHSAMRSAALRFWHAGLSPKSCRGRMLLLHRKFARPAVRPSRRSSRCVARCRTPGAVGRAVHDRRVGRFAGPHALSMDVAGGRC